jgi:Lipoprotein confined to pathogenic Mycobacterium
MTHRRLLSALGLCVTALVVVATGCDTNDPAPPPIAQADRELNALPSLEKTKVDVQAAIDEITSAATEVIPGIVWAGATNAGEGNCEAPYEQTDGRRYFLPNQVAERVSLSERQWSELLQVAKDAAASLDATDEQVMQDQPGHHDVWFTGPAGLFIKFSYKGNLVVSGYTGCRLPEAKRTPSQ